MRDPLRPPRRPLPSRCDVVVVGGGLVGLATALALSTRRPDAAVVLLEREHALCGHQSGHNSGVMHSGIYYRPGSSRAQLCRDGLRRMERFCDEHGVARQACGKVIVASHADELGALDALAERGQANGVRCELVGPERLAELEPHAVGVAALHVPEAGIVDYVEVGRAMARQLAARDVAVVTGATVTGMGVGPRRVVIATTAGDVEARAVVTCGGLYSDRLARMTGRPDARIVPFRGEYYELVPEARSLCRGLIYPVPDPSLPFLGVHVTRSIDGGVHCGPNAVLAFAREGYTARDIDGRDLWETLTWPGFARLVTRHAGSGLHEMWRSASKAAFARAAAKLVPEITPSLLTPAPAGVRAQALGRDGALLDDFVIRRDGRALHVVNAPSPAATASLAIGEHVAEQLDSVVSDAG